MNCKHFITESGVSDLWTGHDGSLTAPRSPVRSRAWVTVRIDLPWEASVRNMDASMSVPANNDE